MVETTAGCPFKCLPNVHVIWTFTHPFRVTSYKIRGRTILTLYADLKHFYTDQMMEQIGQLLMI